MGPFTPQRASSWLLQCAAGIGCLTSPGLRLRGAPLGGLGLAASRASRLAACSAAAASTAAALGLRAASGSGEGRSGGETGTEQKQPRDRAGCTRLGQQHITRSPTEEKQQQPTGAQPMHQVRTCRDDGQPRGWDARLPARHLQLQAVARLQAHHLEHALGLAAL